MGTTINSMGVNLGLNANGFIDGSKVSRAEARMLAKDIAAARNPTEQLAVEQDRLTKALEAGAISVEVYNRLLEEKRRKLLSASEATEKNSAATGGMLDKFSKLGNVTAGARAGFEMLGTGVQFVMDQWEKFDEIAEKLDATKDKAEKLGLTFNELGAIQFATSRLGGADALAALDSAMGKMLKNGFLNAGETAVDAFKRAADEIAGMTTQTERAQRAAEVFGKSGVELLPVLQSGAAAVEELASHWERTNGLTQAQIEMIGEYNDRWEDVKLVTDGIVSIYVAEMAPALTLIAESILGLESSMEAVRDSAATFADMLARGAGYAKDASDIGMFISNPLNPMNLVEAVDTSTADQMQAKLWANRLKFAREAEDKEEERKARLDADRNERESSLERERGERAWKSLKSGFDTVVELSSKAWDRFEKDRETKSKQAIKLIADAEKALEAERKNRDKLRQDIAKGPMSAELGSSEYAKLLADQANQRLAASVVGETKPTEQQLLDEALKQSQLMQQEAAANAVIGAKLQELIAATRENGFKRIR